MKILLVDDEKQLTDALCAILKKNNYSVDCAYNGEDGLDMALSAIYDLIILDIMMPKIDGITVLKTLRENQCSTPVLMLSAKSEITDKIDGLNSGADDYITKPFSTDELLARIKALLRRKEKFTGDVLSYNDLSLDRNTIELVCGQKRVVLGKKEFQILEMLILNQGKSVDKDKLIEKIWGYDTDAEYNTIEVYVSFLRRKLTAVGSKTEIKSIRGIGYTLGK
ncbi:MAG: response regulator transcription factor [Clostridia bacterium]|nr:response regulator transcription factor [Clostridia bacterium]